MADTAKLLTFGGPVILVGAAPNFVGLSGLPPQWPVVAADGGVHAAIAAGRTPMAVIGDMDSVGSLASLPDNIRQIEISGQDDTDFEKCLNVITAPAVIALGFIGGRFDHSLGVMHVMAATANEARLLLAGADDIILRVKGDMALKLPVGTRFSVVPLASQNFVSSTGLVWPLDGLYMEFGHMIGISNRVSSPDVTITAGAGGGYAVIMPFDCLAMLLDQMKLS